MWKKSLISLAAMLGVLMLSSCSLTSHISVPANDSNNATGGNNELQVATPVISPASGIYSRDVNVTIGCSTDGAKIYYTTDGADPTADSELYSEPIVVSGDSTSKTIKAIAISEGLADSNVASSFYIIFYNETSLAPVISPASGNYFHNIEVTISYSLQDAEIYYTTDGSEPTEDSTLYSGPFVISGAGTAETIKAKAFYQSHYIISDVATADYTISAAGYQHPFTIGGVSFNMSDVSGGLIFPTGSDDGGRANVVDAYQIGETEVTYELWSTVYAWATDPARGANVYIFANAGSKGSSGYGDVTQPATYINWRDALVWTNALTEWYNASNGTSYIVVYKNAGVPIRNATDGTTCEGVNPDSAATGFRLPMMNEWGLAARYIGTVAPTTGPLATEVVTTNVGGVTYYWTPGDYASGATADYTNEAATEAVAWYSANSPSGTQDVALLAPNGLGLYDMSGNVWEWLFESAGSSLRIVGGGSWNLESWRIICSNDNGWNPSSLTYNVYWYGGGMGFRLARTVE